MENQHKEMLTFDREYVGALESDDEDNNTVFASLLCKYNWCYMNLTLIHVSHCCIFGYKQLIS